MARIFYSITERQAKKLRGHCRLLSGKISEYPGFSFRRLIYSVNYILDAGVGLDEFRDACKMAAIMHKKGICFRRVCDKIDKVKSIVKR